MWVRLRTCIKFCGDFQKRKFQKGKFQKRKLSENGAGLLFANAQQTNVFEGLGWNINIYLSCLHQTKSEIIMKATLFAWKTKCDATGFERLRSPEPNELAPCRPFWRAY